jgi:hypothetical protein
MRHMEKLHMPGAGRIGWAQWLIVFLLGVIAAGLIAQLPQVDNTAQGQVSGSSKGSELLIVAGQLTRDSYGLYLVDPANSTINIYQWMPDTRKLQLLAGRSFLYDRQLDEYNTEPSPRAIKDLVEKAKRLGSPSTRPGN